MAYTSDQKKDIAGDAALQALGTGAKYAAIGSVVPGLGTLIGGILGLGLGAWEGAMAGQADVAEEEAEKESMDAAEDAAKIERADSKLLQANMPVTQVTPVPGGAASSSSYFNWRQNIHGY